MMETLRTTDRPNRGAGDSIDSPPGLVPESPEVSNFKSGKEKYGLVDAVMVADIMSINRSGKSTENQPFDVTSSADKSGRRREVHPNADGSRDSVVAAPEGYSLVDQNQAAMEASRDQRARDDEILSQLDQSLVDRYGREELLAARQKGEIIPPETEGGVFTVFTHASTGESVTPEEAQSGIDQAAAQKAGAATEKMVKAVQALEPLDIESYVISGDEAVLVETYSLGDSGAGEEKVQLLYDFNTGVLISVRRTIPTGERSDDDFEPNVVDVINSNDGPIIRMNGKRAESSTDAEAVEAMMDHTSQAVEAVTVEDGLEAERKRIEEEAYADAEAAQAQLVIASAQKAIQSIGVTESQEPNHDAEAASPDKDTAETADLVASQTDSQNKAIEDTIRDSEEVARAELDAQAARAAIVSQSDARAEDQNVVIRSPIASSNGLSGSPVSPSVSTTVIRGTSSSKPSNLRMESSHKTEARDEGGIEAEELSTEERTRRTQKGLNIFWQSENTRNVMQKILKDANVHPADFIEKLSDGGFMADGPTLKSMGQLLQEYNPQSAIWLEGVKGNSIRAKAAMEAQKGLRDIMSKLNIESLKR